MTDELIERIKRDREAGTPGPWDWSGGSGPKANGYTANLGIWSEYLLEKAINDGVSEYPDDEKWLAGIWGDIDGTDFANAARIARVPEMEARILSDAEEITRLRTDLCIRRDDPVLRQVIGSLTFLEKQLDSHGFREDGPMLSAVSGALAAMQELIGGKDG